ncbi:hypothetical protein H8958_003919, partial [Nasalis larvatus]
MKKIKRKGGVARQRRGQRDLWRHNKSCARNRCPRPLRRGAGPAFLGCARSLLCAHQAPGQCSLPRAPERPLSDSRAGPSCATEPPDPGASDPRAQEMDPVPGAPTSQLLLLPHPHSNPVLTADCGSNQAFPSDSSPGLNQDLPEVAAGPSVPLPARLQRSAILSCP